MIQRTAATILAALACTAHGAAPLDSSTPDQANPPVPNDEIGRLPKNAFENRPSVGVPYQRLFRNTTSPLYIGQNDLRVSPTVEPTDTTKVTGSVDLPDFRGRFPLLQRGFAPEDADLKIGPLYFKLRQLSAGVVWSDNSRFTERNRDSDVRAIASVGGQIIWQITEASRLAASGNFVWLPLENRAGLTGFTAPLSFGLASTPNARVQATWEPVFFGIPWVFADELRSDIGRYSNGLNDNFDLLEGARLESEPGDSQGPFGLYTFRTNQRRDSNDFRFENRNGNDEVFYYSNEISAATTARVLGDFRFRFRAAHENLWYPNTDNDFLPSERNSVFADLESYRESLRFKPYLRYRLVHRPDSDRLYQSVRLGAHGPVTDLINFDGNFGYLWEQQNNRSRTLWHAHLDHVINPRTRHSLEWSRNLEELSDELTQHVTYNFNHVLGPGLSIDLFAGYNWTEDLDAVFADREEFRKGARLNWRVSPRTTIRLWGQHSDISYADGAFDTETWRGRFEISHRLYDRIGTRLIFQHTDRTSNRAVSYDENIAYFAMSYFFE